MCKCVVSFSLQKDEVYLNLVLDFVPETVYRVARHFNKAKTTIPIIYVKVGKHSAWSLEGRTNATWAQFSFCFRVFRRSCFICDHRGDTLHDWRPLDDQGTRLSCILTKTHSGLTTGLVVSLDVAPLFSLPSKLGNSPLRMPRLRPLQLTVASRTTRRSTKAWVPKPICVGNVATGYTEASWGL